MWLTGTRIRLNSGSNTPPNKADVRSALKRWSYRAGVRYGTYNQTFGGVDVNEYAVTLGVGIPLTVLGGILGASSVDLGVEVGGRGSFKVDQRTGESG